MIKGKDRNLNELYKKANLSLSLYIYIYIYIYIYKQEYSNKMGRQPIVFHILVKQEYISILSFASGLAHPTTLGMLS
jgi:hypothetical protein